MSIGRRQSMILKSIGCCVVVVLGASVGAGSMSRASQVLVTEQEVGAKQMASLTTHRQGVRGRPVRWTVLGRPGSKRVTIGSTVGWCPGATRPKPRIRRVRQVDRGRAVILTAFLAHPAPQSASGAASCPGVELALEYVVTFHRLRNGRALYDGSTTPPSRRWPRHSRHGS
jgi:hypothetical protein